MRAIATLLTFVLLGLSPVAAKDFDGEFAVFSVGGKSCAEYLDARRTGGRVQHDFTTWVQGYLSAFNLIVPNTYDILGTRDFDNAVQWLDQHCLENRETPFVNATALLTINLFPARKNMAPGKDNRAKWAGESESANPTTGGSQ